MNWLNFRRGLMLFLVLVLALSGQQRGQTVDVSAFPPRSSPTVLMFYDGAVPPNRIYTCYANPIGPWNNNSVPATFSWTRTASTLTSIVDSGSTSTVTTSTAHGLQVGNLVTVSGATVDTDLNGTYYIQSVGSTTTLTITTSGVTDATYTEATLAVATSVARSTQPIWSIEKRSYTAANLDRIQWARNGSGDFGNVCDDRATTTGATKITYR